MAFYPDQLQDDTSSPEVVLTGLRISGEPVAPGPEGPLAVSLSVAEEVKLAHDDNDLTIEYVGMHFINPEETRYRYRLDGYDEDWVEAGTQRSARYAGLPSGDYVFRITAASSNGVWNEEGASIRVTITPPWWRTTWAYAFYGLLFAAGVFAAGRFQRRRLIRQEREKARERELEQAREIEKAHMELQQSHEHLKATQQQLVQQEKMASLGQLTAGIAHEIKNPLNFVNNFSEIVVELGDELQGLLGPHLDASLQGEADDFRMILSDLKQNAGVIVQHGKRADGIVRAMMQHASGGSGQREATDLNALVSEHIDLAYHGKRAQVPELQVEIQRDLGAEVGDVEIVPQDMGRVLLNLLGNAFDAVNERADAETRGRGDAETGYVPAVTVLTRRNGEVVEIRIADNGPGIPAILREKIFEPFFTTKPAGSGTGLGLSLSYDIVTQGHGGTLAVERTKGQGATFVITLPHEAPAD